MDLTTKELLDLIVILELIVSLEHSGGVESLLGKLQRELDRRRRTYEGVNYDSRIVG